MADARFEDGAEGPLLLLADSAEDLGVLSALIQDAILPVTEMRYDRRRRRFNALINRFRWEDRAAAEAEKRPYERVRSLLTIEDVSRIGTMGIDQRDSDLILSILTLEWHPAEDGMGRLVLVLAGDGAISLEVETIGLRLEDVTRPYIAPSRHMPDHGV